MYYSRQDINEQLLFNKCYVPSTVLGWEYDFEQNQKKIPDSIELTIY